MIWIQWALLYLTDGAPISWLKQIAQAAPVVLDPRLISLAWAADDAVAFFDRCRQGLKPDGVIIVKENICSAEANFVVDKVPCLLGMKSDVNKQQGGGEWPL